MRKVLISVFAWTILFQGAGYGRQAGNGSRAAAHPDLSGVLSYPIDRAPSALKKEVSGKVTLTAIDQSARHGDATTVRGALPSTPRPAYKPEHQAKVKE